MMCCHALSLLPSKQLKADSPHQQELIGSEMEKRMFRATEAFFEDILDSRGEQMTLVHLPPTDRRPVGLPFAYLEILKVFSFDHARQSMAVVAREVRNGGSSPEVVRGDVLVFVKGSFEKVSAMCVFLYLTVGGPSAFTCIFRTNCDNATSSSFKNGVLAVVSRVGEGLPFHGEGGDNIFPLKWKMVLSLLCLLNSLVNMAVDRLIINGPPAAYYRRVAEKELSQDKAALP
eukprot:Polyplicarium_translucidae@DN1750_c0_g1_i1.p1